MNSLKNQKLFPNFLFHFWNLHQILSILKKGMIVLANVFPKSQILKIFVRPLSKHRRFRTRIDRQHVKASKLIPKMSPLVLGDILGVFLNTLNAEDKYPAQDCENLPLQIQIKLSEKRKCFSEIFIPFIESTSNLKHSERKDDLHS